jgi:hypothetical protein
MYRSVPHIYFWLKWACQGKQGILGPFANEAKAEREAESKLRGAQFKIIPLDTRNKSAASGKLKAVILDETHDISQAMQRLSHQEPTDNILRENKQVIHWT